MINEKERMDEARSQFEADKVILEAKMADFQADLEYAEAEHKRQIEAIQVTEMAIAKDHKETIDKLEAQLAERIENSFEELQPSETGDNESL